MKPIGCAHMRLPCKWPMLRCAPRRITLMPMSGMPPPMRVIPVNPPYATALSNASAGRPGVVTAVGVVSIVLAIVQAISAFGWLGFAFTSMVTAQVQQRQTAMMNMGAYAVQPGVDAAPKGFPEPVARAVVQGLVRRHALSGTRQSHVRKLLMQQGRELLPFVEDATVSSQRIAAQVSDCGPMGGSSDYYEVGQGRLEVTDQQAIFRRTDGKVFRSNDAVVDRALTEAQITQAITQLQWVVNGNPSQVQIDAIRAKLRDPAQAVLTPGESPGTGGILSDKTLWFITSAGQVRVTPAGEIQTLNFNAPIPGTNPFSGKPISTFWAGLTMLDAAVTGLLAVPLLIAGILILRGRPIGRRMHFWWAWLKMPLAILGAMVCGFAVAEWMGALTSAPGAAPPSSAAGGWTTAVSTGTLGVVYPVVLLIVLTRQRVRRYFEGVI